MNQNQRSRVTCFVCGEIGHMTSDCPENQKGETAGPQTPEIICLRCKEYGHRVANCPQVTCFKCKNKGHVPSSCPINILEGKTTKKTDSMEEVKARQKEICYHCKDPGHKKKNCPTVTCFKCNQLGHMTPDCQDIQNKRGENSKVIF